MTIVEFYEHVLTELNKVEAPSLLLEDFNYFANKAVQQYINEVYNRYDTNQQTTDDLSALKKSTRCKIITPTETAADSNWQYPGESNVYYSNLPQDYMHLLNCVVEFEHQNAKCLKDEKLHSMARRMTSDEYPSIIKNAYFKPSYKCPYFFITNGDNSGESLKIEIRSGDDKKYKPTYIYIDYVCEPSLINLTYEDIEDVDASKNGEKELEFPEYVCYEIINRLVKLILENASDPRLQTHLPINKTIPESIVNK